jgi:hypothetical protein
VGITTDWSTDRHRHFNRVIKYARPSDYVAGAVTAAAGPALMVFWEKISPSHVGKGGFAPIMRLAGAVGLGAGFLVFYQSSICTSSNRREVSNGPDRN